MSATRIRAVRLACRDVEAALDFHRRAFDCRDDEAEEGLRALRLGRQRLEFVPAASEPGLPPPSNATGFQHCAIIVSDMGAALARLAAASGWSAISSDGPEHLPERSGGVSAFKFRDPEGHPLEFLQFPPGAVPEPWAAAANGPCLGIDHSAITVADADRSIAFYAALGFSLGARQLNRGPEQGRMDGLGERARVEVVTLEPVGGGPPHLELLCYRDPATRPAPAPDGSSFATVLRLGAGAGPNREIRDPDGHRLLVPAGARPA